MFPAKMGWVMSYPEITRTVAGLGDGPKLLGGNQKDSGSSRNVGEYEDQILKLQDLG